MNTKRDFITEPVKEVKIIVDDVTFIFEGPKKVLIEDMNIEHGGWLGDFSFGFKIETMNHPKVYRTIKENGLTKHERIL